ncbi:scavenger receptor cysteine-rich type 1 protein M160-like [Lingula anatina]|uniref:Scavenger receptor cysteine-rich type 1 protein M160-like n=1 Tax=Lingula anatina TaxID=7574 RepID=A0A1S3JBH0_LINAN|nr:scavenger receptor cysteine-rich type 1 protein M160-like [Lingula anatina]|eukprot:XP_013407747.1 scavenger receptor cysteine-rich type 1 protein M160-like [Lingula anatina]
MKSTGSEWFPVLVVCMAAFLSQDVHGIQTQLSGSWFGRVEVLREDTNQWGTICRNDFTDSEAAAVCKSLNYATGKSVNTWLHQASRPIHFDQVSCGNGSHDNIGTCLYGGVPLDNLNITEWGDFSSLNCEDAVVFCWNVSEPEFRLVPGPNYGRVEMAIDGNWGTICSRHWHWQDARVLCKELGFIGCGYLF